MLGIFEHALKKLHCAPETVAMIGDSLTKDCAPAHKLGMRTVWLRTEPRPAEDSVASRRHNRKHRRSRANPMVTELQGAIIAAGRGERLRASTRDEIPKPLVMLGGEAMLSRQARALLDAGASSVVAMINSETARVAKEMALEIPPSLRLVVRDTANSMETMLALGRRARAGMVYRIDGGRCNSTGRTREFC